MVTGINLKILVVSFGQYLKFYVKKDSIQQPTSGLPNALQILMSSQARQSTQTLPSSIAQPRNKEELHNAIIAFCQNENLTWTPSEVSGGVAHNTVRMLSDVLWYIDGQHTKLSERSCEVPVIFTNSQFTGYNNPERSKHRKRAITSLSCDVLAFHAQRLFSNLQSGFWDRSTWRYFKWEVELLSRSLEKYCDILKCKKQRMLELHHVEEQVRSISNSMTVYYIPSRHTVSSNLQDLCTRIESAATDEVVSLLDTGVLPQD